MDAAKAAVQSYVNALQSVQDCNEARIKMGQKSIKPDDLQKMRDAGIMQIVAVTDPLQVGFRSQAMVGIRADGDTRLVARRLAEVDDIDYVVLCTGSFDILVELVTEDEDTLLELLNGVIRQIPGVRDTETFMYLKVTKQTYAWGTR